MRHNPDIDNLPDDYPFRKINAAVAEAEEGAGYRVIRKHIGDVLGPISPVVGKAIHKATDEQMEAKSFEGYGFEEGIPEVREEIANYVSRVSGVAIGAHEVFINYGIKDELLHVIRLIAPDTVVAVEKPFYPAIETALALSGLSGEWRGKKDRYSRIDYRPCTEENGWFPEMPEESGAGVLILNRPNNPLGIDATTAQLQTAVNWGNATGSVVIMDGAYEAWGSVNILGVPGAKKCVVLMISGSKGDAMTGTRGGALIIPEDLQCESGSLYEKWTQMVGFIKNGPGRANQFALKAAFSPQNEPYRKEWIDYTKETARIAREGLTEMGLSCIGGVGPYLNAQAPHGMTAKAYADLLLWKAGVAVTPSPRVFGMDGEYVRFHLLGSHGDMTEAMDRISRLRLPA